MVERYKSPRHHACQDWRICLPNNEWGDFQTPPELVRKIIETLPAHSWGRVLEPTCGTGSFMRGAAALRPKEVIGIEVQHQYAGQARAAGQVIEGDLFRMNLRRELHWA